MRVPGGCPPGLPPDQHGVITRLLAPFLLTTATLAVVATESNFSALRAFGLTSALGMLRTPHAASTIGTLETSDPAAQTPGNATPRSPGAQDQAAVTFTTDVGLLLVPVKPDKVADYEAALRALQRALSAAEDPNTRALASGWRVFKAVEMDAKAPALYVHLLNPVVPSADYRPSLWLDKMLAGAPPDLLAKYRDAFAGSPTKLALAEFANMSVAPVAQPTNTSPSSPPAPAKPKNQSPDRTTSRWDRRRR